MVRLTDRPDMTLDVYRGRKTTMQQQCYLCVCLFEDMLIKVAAHCGLVMFVLNEIYDSLKTHNFI